jgi:hypothetical protein
MASAGTVQSTAYDTTDEDSQLKELTPSEAALKVIVASKPGLDVSVEPSSPSPMML